MDHQDDQPAPPITSTPEPGAAESATTEQRLTLALRMLAHQTHTAPANLSMLPEQAPDNLPFTLPLPPGAHIVGSMTHTEPPNGAPVVTILVDAPLPPEQSVAFYTGALEAANWTQDVMPHMHGGFLHAQPGGFTFVNFHSAAGDWMLTISTMSKADERETTLSIMLRKDQRPNWVRSGRTPDMMALIPPLLPPPGASQQGGGGGGSAGRWQTNASVETSLPIMDLLAHYDRQLEKGGWRRRDGGASGPAGWSFWAFQDNDGEPWRGVFLALNNPDRPRDYLVFVQIEAESSSGQQGGGFSIGGTIAQLRGR